MAMIPIEHIQSMIYLIRGQKAILDRDLAVLYGVQTKALKQAVRRNASRFSSDFMFILNKDEFFALRSHFVISNKELRGGTRYPPMAFTEQGVGMLSSVLNSERAIHVNIAVMRTFVHLWQLLALHADLARKLDALEKKYDAQFRVVFDAIRQLMKPPDKPRKRIGFEVREPKSRLSCSRERKRNSSEGADKSRWVSKRDLILSNSAKN